MLDLQKLKNPSLYDYKLVDNLKGGKGRCEVYTNKNPNAPHTSEGVICMMAVNGIYPSIGRHQHIDDEETYTVIYGIFEVNDVILMPGHSMTCKMGEFHNAQLTSENGALRFQKRLPSAA